MNYLKIYEDIIGRAKNRILTSYKEKHHIIPKCMLGTNDKSNLVNLTAKEHFMCHRLLVLIYPNNSKLKFALWMMNTKSNNQERYKISARIYKRLKEESVSFRKGKKSPKSGNRTLRTKKQKKEQSLKMKGRVPPNKGVSLSEEVREKMSIAQKKRDFSKEIERNEKIRKGNENKVVSKETKQKISKKMELIWKTREKKDSKVEIVCNICNLIFKVEKGRKNSAKYCSKKCMAIAYKNKFK